MIQIDRLPTAAFANLEARPFLKWAGGKSQLLTQFEPYYPSQLLEGSITRYVEPFLGGGAVFLAIVQKYPIKEAFLADINPELILIYTVVQRAVEALVEQLKDYEQQYLMRDEEQRSPYFYQVRELYNSERVDFKRYSSAWIKRAARMLFLNKTCFNGLFRVNTNGEFNVPFGRYKNPAICDAENLRRVSNLLQNVMLRVAPFDASAEWINDSTFVYFDPPYRPISQTASFTSYASNKFGDDTQVALAKFFAELDARTNAKLMLSNSDPGNVSSQDDFFDRLYGKFQIHRVLASRMINSQADKRGKITELLITNY